jgi:hypothetical protein
MESKIAMAKAEPSAAIIAPANPGSESVCNRNFLLPAEISTLSQGLIYGFRFGKER